MQTLGTRSVVLITGLLLLALALPFLRELNRGAQVAVLAAALGASALMGLRHGLTTSCDRESAYFCIRVVDQTALAPFGEADKFVLGGIRAAMKNVEILVRDSQSNPNRAGEVAVGAGEHRLPRQGHRSDT